MQLAEQHRHVATGGTVIPQKSQSPWCAGRFITGFAAGAITLFTPRYIAETAPPAIRGAVGSLSQVSSIVDKTLNSGPDFVSNGSC